MLGPQLLRLVRNMQRIRKQQQRVGNAGVFGRQHRRLPPAIRMASQHQRPVADGSQKRRGVAQAGAIFPRRITRRRTARLSLAKWQIAAQHGKPAVREHIRNSDQQRSLAVCAGSMSDDQARARCSAFWLMEKSPNAVLRDGSSQ